MDRVHLYLLSFFTNAVILVFEIAGGRLLAPYIGTTVGVWAGLIAVVLGGMAFGYHYGGKLGDKDASRERIGFFLFLAGIAALFAWGARDLIPTFLAPTGYASPTLGALIIGTLLFVPTVVFLAIVSPMIAKNLLKQLNESARVIGELNAAGTAGAIIGAVATGMLLIPYFSVDLIFLGIAVSILVAAFLVSEKRMRKLLVLLIALAFALALNAVPNAADGWVADITTTYNRVVLTERTQDAERTLYLATNPFGYQCAMYVDDEGRADEDRLVKNYQLAHDTIVRSFFPDGPKRMLFLGGCVFTFPRYLLSHFPDSSAEVVEIDPGMTDVAKEYFGFFPERFPTLSIINEDARIFVNQDHAQYDIVYHDTFDSAGRVPFQLMTKEMFERVAALVNEDGLLLINAHGAYQGEGLLYPSAYAKTIAQSFKNVALYQFTNSPLRNQNLVILASHTRELPDALSHPLYPDLMLKKEPLRENVIVLTDDYAPVDGIAREKLRVN